MLLSTAYRPEEYRNILAAASYGMPAAAFDSGAVSEVIRDGVTGFCVPYGDVEAAVVSLSRLVENRAMVSEMGVNARLMIERDFQQDMISERFRTFIQNAAL